MLKPLWLGLRYAVLIMLCSAWLTACDSQPDGMRDYPHGSGGINASHQLEKPYLILISIDGFRWDYLDRILTPNMDRIAASGSKAERLLPVFPTLTFPNHYTIATGLYPANHNLVANNFPDPERNKWYSLKNRDSVEDPGFYAGEPIWVTAETQGMVTAAFYFVGTEAAIKGVSPTHWRSYNKEITGEERVDQVLNWLAEPASVRPHLYTLYFEDVDDYSHWYGPDSEENYSAINRVDGYLGRLLDGLEKLPYSNQINIILVSDHGQGAFLDDPRTFVLDEHLDVGSGEIVEGGAYLFLHLEDDTPTGEAEKMVATINSQWQHGKAYTTADAPEQWQLDDNPRFPDVILVSDPGFAVISTTQKAGKITAGDHGWAPESPDMHGIFLASGPGIKAGIELGPVQNIDIYPLMVSLLGLEPAVNVDGDARRLANLLEID